MWGGAVAIEDIATAMEEVIRMRAEPRAEVRRLKSDV